MGEKINMSIEKSIGWTDRTCNPIKGKCKGGCWYCWTKPLYKRKFLQPKIHLDLDVFFKLPKSPKKIFLCSTHDLFGEWVQSWWRTAIFERIEAHPQHTFQILTKFPENIDRPMPDNVWLGITVEDGFELERRMRSFQKIEATKKFISFEPLLAGILWANYLMGIDWVIVGRLTGHGHENDPEKRFIESIMEEANWKQIPVFLKNNLKRIWGESLIQEFPK